MPYAENTGVPVERSQAEIAKLLAKYNATQFATGWDETRAMLSFVAQGRLVRFLLAMPDHKARNRDQEIRRRWRALVLVVKSKLTAVETGIETFEQAFLPHIVLADGKTVSDFLLPQLAEAYERKEMPKLLPGVVGK